MQSTFIDVGGDAIEVFLNPTGRTFHKNIRNNNYKVMRFMIAPEESDDVIFVEGSRVTHKQLVDELRPRAARELLDDRAPEDCEWIKGRVKLSDDEQLYTVCVGMSDEPSEKQIEYLDENENFQKALMHRDYKYFDRDEHIEKLKS